MGETLYEYWERFKRLCSSCPYHQISDQLLIQYFYEGLLSMDRSMIDAASGGALVDLTPAAAKNLISNMAANSQQFWTRAEQNPRRVHEVSTSSLENRIEELTSLVRQCITGGQQQIRACSICSTIGHATDMCPTLHEETNNQVNAAGVFPGPAQRNYDPYSNSYNQG